MWLLLACAVESTSPPEAEEGLGESTGCPSFTGYDRVGRGAAFVNEGAPAWGRRVAVEGLGDDATLTVTATTTTDDTTGFAPSSETDTLSLTCDADGLWLLGWTSTLTDAGGDHTAVLRLDAPYRLLPAELTPGATWTQQRAGVFVGADDDGSDLAWTGPVDTYTVEDVRDVTTPAGVFPAWRVSVARDFGTNTPDAVQHDGYAYAADAGLVAVDSGGTETGAVLARWW